MKQRVEIKERMGSTLITWKTLNCEVCKTPYPFAVYFNGKIYELVNYRLPEPPYVIFEHYSKESADSHGLFIVSFATKASLRLGRHNDNEIRISDVSVSRHHSVFNWVAGSAYIQDYGSKFGTLALLQKPRYLVPGELYAVQCGRTLIELLVEQSWSFFSCFKTGDNGKLKAKEEESKISPEDCLPGEGKHSVLVVKMKAYNRLLRTEEKLRLTNKTPVLKGCPLKPCKMPGLDETGIDFLHRQKTMAQPNLSRVEFRLYGENFLIEHRGDNADDVDDRDCQ